jgi:hypothetical protein
MVEQPRPEHGDRALRQAPEWPPRLLGPRRRGQLRPPSHPVHLLVRHRLLVVVILLLISDGLPQRRSRPPPRRCVVEPEPAQDGAAQVAEVARHGLRHKGRVRGRRAGAQCRLERRRHAAQLGEVALLPALQLQSSIRRRDFQ